MGLPVMLAAPRDNGPLEQWAGMARDAFLVKAAHLFGIPIRELHPPEAARGLESADEFVQHFDASYRPLILRALEHGQPVLAWLRANDFGNEFPIWGQIVDPAEQGIGLKAAFCAAAASSASSGSVVVTLSRPPVQVYIVEETTPAAPPPAAIRRYAWDHWQAILSNRVGDRFGVITGPGAFDAWIDRLDSGSEGSEGAAAVVRGHQCLARATVAAHQAAVAFIDKMLDEGIGADISRGMSIRDACQEVVESLSHSTDAYDVGREYATQASRLKLMSHVASARSAASSARVWLESVPTRLGREAD
ncbi:MAG: hypothetical protein JSV78_14750 [Phycisphaerales bacterium]|nr:MAG: hypothetical protein JSV78_14750 [Phycisphaerales bacterium]